MNGYIKIDRKLLDWGWYDDPNTMRVFLHLLLTATWKDTEYKGHSLKAGQAIFGLNALSNRLGLSVQQVRTALEHLKSTGEITIKSTNKFSIATVENWAKYQVEESEPTNNQQTNNKRATTSKENKNKRRVFTPPTLKQVRAYAEEKQSPVDPEYFWNYYNADEWEGVHSWKQKFITWDRRERERQGNRPQQERVKYDF